MQRYLLSFNYLGNRFSGSQKLINRIKSSHLSAKLRADSSRLNLLDESETKLLEKEERTVQGALETALDFRIRPLNSSIIFLSSRTDTGVHAYKNTATVDLQHKLENQYFDPQIITQKLNYHFYKRNLDLRSLNWS